MPIILKIEHNFYLYDEVIFYIKLLFKRLYLPALEKKNKKSYNTI